MRKRFLPFALAGCAAGPVLSATVDVPRLADPVFADRETAPEASLPERAAGTEVQVFRIVLAFRSTLSNNVQIAFGRDDRPTDGALAAEETDLIIGWDGEWFAKGRGLTNRFAAAASDAATPKRRTLTAEIRLTENGAVKRLSLTDSASGSFVLPGLSSEPFPPWLIPDRWTRLRVTARGAGAADAAAAVRFGREGASVIFK